MLQTLITANRSNAREAAQSTLEKQAEGTSIASNRIIATVAQANATRSAEALVPFVHRAVKDVPTWVALTVRDADDTARVAVGLSRTPHASRTTVLHACALAPPALRPPAAAGVGVLCSVATQELAATSSDEAHHPGGILERYALLARLRKRTAAHTQDSPRSVLGGRDASVAASLQRFIDEETMRALPSAAGGITRSFVAVSTMLTVHRQTVHSARQLAEEAVALHAEAATRDLAGLESSLRCASTLGKLRRETERVEPFCTPAPRLAVGIRLNELLRRFMQGRSRKNEPCRVLLGHHTSAELGRDAPPISDAEPLPLATITDFDVRVASSDVGGEAMPHGCPLPHRHVRAKIAVHICLHAATRAPEMIAALDDAWQARAVLHAASSQASYIGDVGAAVSAATANASINSSKKISVRRLPRTACAALCMSNQSRPPLPPPPPAPLLAVCGCEHAGAAVHLGRLWGRHRQRAALLCRNPVLGRLRPAARHRYVMLSRTCRPPPVHRTRRVQASRRLACSVITTRATSEATAA